jgi:hypothetical protein
MAESVEHQFPHPELTSLSATSTPTTTSLKLLRKEINANAMSITSTRGGGQYGHLALTTPAADFLLLSGTAFTPPVHPGPAPIHEPNSTQHRITEVNRAYAANLKEFNVYIAVDANLKKQLIKAVPDTFIDELSDELLGYAKTTTLSLLNHLTSTYGTVTDEDLNDNLADLSRPWTSAQPLEDLWKQIKRCQLVAQHRDPISEALAVRSAVINLDNSGVFIDTLKEWRNIPLADRTMIRLKTLFNKANFERKRQLTSTHAGYNANALPPPTPQALGAQQPVKTPNPNPNPSTNLKNLYYCWSHGLGGNPHHDSASCRQPQPGHRTDATVYNMFGGVNLIHRQRGEKTLCKPVASSAPRFAPAPSAPRSTHE